MLLIKSPTHLETKKNSTESLADEDGIAPNDLNLEEISNLRKFDASYVIRMLKEGLFSEAGKQTLFEYLPFTLADDDDTSGDTYNELNEGDGKGNGDKEVNRSDSQSEGESTDDCIDDGDRSCDDFAIIGINGQKSDYTYLNTELGIMNYIEN